MALRTFQSNPSLGGFGSESTNTLLTRNGKPLKHDGDAFAQILKELVDNAVDACNVQSSDGEAVQRRVRVDIQKFDTGEGPRDGEDILLVTVTDNGSGMDSIQACVDPFHTSKAHGSTASQPSSNETSSENGRKKSLHEEKQTAGRYGVGLTLCLLHAQRLVPGSCTSIKSATKDQESWSTVICSIDTENDAVDCVESQSVAKRSPTESGTCVSLLVPGGESAAVAWPRLAEYFARFKLSVSLPCSLEVLAPSLSKVPLFIRPPDMDAESNTSSTKQKTKKEKEKLLLEETKDRIWMASRKYLGRSFPSSDVAHACVPIRLDGVKKADDGPKLEVSLVVHGPSDPEEENDMESLQGEDSPRMPYAPLVLVRMVNRIPILDSAEASACGLVHAVASKKRVWNSFGLNVARGYENKDLANLLIFEVKDSEQVAPFFEKGNHAQLNKDEVESDTEDESATNISHSNNDGESIASEKGRKRRRPMKRRQSLLPASVRLGNIVMLIQVHAKPSDLPMPTLSKGRLPSDVGPIDAAFEIGLNQCLRSLQESNPALLLTAAELRVAERDARYIPAIASSLASILKNSSNDMEAERCAIQAWRSEEDHGSDKRSEDVEQLGWLVESRLRLVLKQQAEAKKRKGAKKRDDDSEPGDNESYASELTSGFPEQVTPPTPVDDMSDTEVSDLEDW